MTMGAYLSPPPIYEPLMIKDESGKLMNNPVWVKWFDGLNSLLAQVFVAGKSNIDNRSLLLFQLLQMTTTRRNSIINPDDGLMIYNTTTATGQIREGGTWNNI